jgi:hypothetical protein
MIKSIACVLLSFGIMTEVGCSKQRSTRPQDSSELNVVVPGTHFTLAEIRSPTPHMIGALVETEGFLQPHAEEDFLTSDIRRFSDMLELSYQPMLTELPQEKRYARRMEIEQPLEQRWVLVRGRVRVGPFGMSNRATVYLEVESIRAANQPAEPTAPSGRGSP